MNVHFHGVEYHYQVKGKDPKMNRSEEIANARKVDTEVARLWNEAHKVYDEIDQLTKRRDEKVKYALQPHNQSERYQIEADKVIGGYEARIAELLPVAREAREAAINFDDENYKGWQRFFLVKHIHSNMHCSSFRMTTRVGWLPDVSGLTEAEAVAAHGETLCTICFPSAPTELTTKAVDPDLCTGFGKFHDREHLTGRENAYSSPSGYCPECGLWNTLTKFGAMRKHKVDPTRRHW